MANEYGELDPISLNISGASDLVQSRINRVTRGISNQEEGPRGPERDLLDLPMSDGELILLANQW